MKLDTIYNEDCIEGMKKIPDESIDLIVTDPPYFLTNRSGVGFMNLTWDSISDKIKLLWLNNEFVRFAEKFFISLPQEKNGEEEFIAQESVNMKELNKTIEKQENVQFAEVSLKLQNLLQKDFVQGIVITKQEVLDLLKEWCGNHINDIPLLNGAEENALYVVPLSLLKNEVKNSVHANVTKKIKVRKCKDKKIHLTLTDALKINDALEDITGNKSERLSMQEIITLAKFAGNTAEEKKFNVTISENIKKPEIIRHLTLLLCVLYAMQKQTTIPNIIIENFFKIIFLETLRVLKPGAFAFVMCIPRQDCLSKMIVSLDNAGFNINFTSLYHVFASGFPKAMSISRAADKRLGTKRKILGYAERFGREGRKANCGFKKGYVGASGTQTLPSMKVIDEPATSQAKSLDGSYVGFQPKPAVEVILVAMKPLETKTYIGQALKNRKGITWLDDGRIPYRGSNDIPNSIVKQTIPQKIYGGGKGLMRGGWNPKEGRFPADLLVSDDVLNDGEDWKGGQNKSQTMSIFGNKMKERKQIKKTSNLGSFSRYFSLNAWWEEKIKHLPENVKKIFPFLIVPKASKSEKNRGCENLYWEKDNSDFGYHQVNKERWEWLGQEEERIFKETKERTSLKAQGNIHVTTKPIKLMSYLITIGSRKGDVILDPFTGSGTTLISAKMLGRKYIGYEINKEYCEIAKQRLANIVYQEKLNFG